MLDLDFGTYPYVTSSNPSIGGIATGLGLAPSKFGALIGVVSTWAFGKAVSGSSWISLSILGVAGSVKRPGVNMLGAMCLSCLSLVWPRGAGSVLSELGVPKGGWVWLGELGVPVRAARCPGDLRAIMTSPLSRRATF